MESHQNNLYCVLKQLQLMSPVCVLLQVQPTCNTEWKDEEAIS